jgi:hypothetical protein
MRHIKDVHERRTVVKTIYLVRSVESVKVNTVLALALNAIIESNPALVTNVYTHKNNNK